MRRCEVAALCIMLAVHPIAITGNVSIRMYITNSPITPILMLPLITYKPPIKIVSNVLMPIIKPIAGK